MAYHTVNGVASWLMVSVLYVMLAMVLRMMFSDEDPSDDFGIMTFIIAFYVCMLLFTLLISLSAPPKEAENLYKGLMVLFGFY